ncbi:hypothetical protein JZ751_024015 [Albula glossodonta]|uniref:Uncharacterized protein n=1 Tax=Albula glossodonta TaxID=121402 RepID=A0A8T2NS48_9TELE|nr:hypothetical protein JZ751_024015 [Albula glossodonta]
MAAATSSSTTTATLPIKHSSSDHTRKRIDPRRRQAALSFLSNISLDGRPVKDDGDNQGDEDGSVEARTRQCLVSAERAVYPAGATATAAQTLAAANQALMFTARGSFGISQLAAPICANPEGDSFACGLHAASQSVFSSPFPAVPAATRGRLQTYTQGILPVTFTRQTSQNYCCMESGQIGSAALELQRSRVHWTILYKERR